MDKDQFKEILRILEIPKQSDDWYRSKFAECKKVFEPSKDVLKRIEAFKKELYPYCKSKGGKYPDEMVKEFFEHYSELTRNKKKMLCEIPKTWQTAGRLVTWERNTHKFGSQKQQKPEPKPMTDRLLITD